MFHSNFSEISRFRWLNMHRTVGYKMLTRKEILGILNQKKWYNLSVTKVKEFREITMTNLSWVMKGMNLHIRWPTYWSFNFSISPSNEYSGVISFRMDIGSPCSPRDSQESSPTPQFKSTNFSALQIPVFLYEFYFLYI